MAALTRYWRDWIARYAADGAYWYVPKGKSIADVITIQKQLRILQKFEGLPWRENQKGYLTALKKAGLSDASAEDGDHKGVPIARMLTRVFSTLGFAWIDGSEAVTLTPAGEAFIASPKPADILAHQAKRYQIANPLAGQRESQSMEIHPVPYLLEVLESAKTLTRLEYILFCAKTKNFGDFEDSIHGIMEWRKLGPVQQERIVEALDAINISESATNSRRSSIYNTISLNASYAIAFWASSRVIKATRENSELTMSIPRERMPEASQMIQRSKTEGQYISFATAKDWMAFYGDPGKSASKSAALGYYTETGQLDLVRQVLDEMGDYTEQQKRQYLSMIVSEQTVEDILAGNMELIEPGMKLLERQLVTEVGRIDLFARDKNGVFTIIELKKGKTDDDVFGQLSRYLGWCKKTKARTGNVRGIIIAKHIGLKLWAAADGHDTQVEFFEYDLKMSLDRANRAPTARA